VQWAQDLIDRQIQQMSRLVEDLLDLSRITRNQVVLRKEEVELASVIQAAVETSQPLIRQGGHELIISLPSQPVYLDADLTRLAQVFSNLLNNAAKYTDRGGKIWLTAMCEGDELAVSVRDNGVGIPEAQLPLVFEMFTQVDRTLERSQTGLGIGLALVKRLVEMHGGTITGHSDGPGNGSEFRVRLPVGVRVGSSWGPRQSGPGPARSRFRILVVDDNTDNTDSLGMMLRLLGNDVRTAYDGRTALAVGSEFHPEIVVLDLGMPGLDGYATCQIMRQQSWGRDARIIALTGWGQQEHRQRTRECGFDEHVVKPVDPSALMSVLAAR
jgi:CheY-like chemotaxis protein